MARQCAKAMCVTCRTVLLLQFCSSDGRRSSHFLMAAGSPHFGVVVFIAALTAGAVLVAWQAIPDADALLKIEGLTQEIHQLKDRELITTAQLHLGTEQQIENVSKEVPATLIAMATATKDLNTGWPSVSSADNSSIDNVMPFDDRILPAVTPTAKTPAPIEEKPAAAMEKPAATAKKPAAAVKLVEEPAPAVDTNAKDLNKTGDSIQPTVAPSAKMPAAAMEKPAAAVKVVEKSAAVDTNAKDLNKAPATQVPCSGRRVYWCGYVSDAMPLMRAVMKGCSFPGEDKIMSASARDVVFVVGNGAGGCPGNIGSFPGLIVYLDVEHGWNVFMKPSRKERLLYVGVSDVEYVTKNAARPVWGHRIPENMVLGVPGFMQLLALTQEKLNRLTGLPFESERNHFVLFLSSHCTMYRQRAFDQIVAFSKKHGIHGKITAGGACHGTHPELHEKVGAFCGAAKCEGQMQIFSKFRFALVLENHGIDGYISEKIADALAGGSIPIYFGSPKAPVRYAGTEAPELWPDNPNIPYEPGAITEMYNTKRIIFWDPYNPQKALEKLKYLEENPAAYVEMHKLPILADGQNTIEKYFSMYPGVGNTKLSLANKIRSSILNAFNKPVDSVDQFGAWFSMSLPNTQNLVSRWFKKIPVEPDTTDAASTGAPSTASTDAASTGAPTMSGGDDASGFIDKLEWLQYSKQPKTCSEMRVLQMFPWGLFSGLNSLVTVLLTSMSQNKSTCFTANTAGGRSGTQPWLGRWAYYPDDQFRAENKCALLDCYFRKLKPCLATLALQQQCNADWRNQGIHRPDDDGHLEEHDTYNQLAKSFPGLSPEEMRSLITRWVFQPSDPVLEFVNHRNQQTHLPESYISMHIRWGDKASEMGKKPLIKYVDLAKEIVPLVDESNVVVVTIDPGAVTEVNNLKNTPAASGMNFFDLTHKVTSYNGWDHGDGNVQMAIEAVADMHVLLSGVGAVVSFSSNFGQWVYWYHYIDFSSNKYQIRSVDGEMLGRHIMGSLVKLNPSTSILSDQFWR